MHAYILAHAEEEEENEEDEDEESVKIMFYLYFIAGVIFSSKFLHVVTFLHVLHLDVLIRQIEIETESKNNISLCMAIMLDHPWQSLYTQYYRTV